MRYIITAGVFFLITFLSSEGLAQTVIIDEDFSDGDHTNNPTWTDNESKHVVNTSNKLQLDAAEETGEAAITTLSDAAFGEWEALIELDFNPSGSNFSRFYIISDSEDLKGNLNGYFIQIGDTEDEVSLYRQDGNATTKIIDGTDDLVDVDPVTVRIKVTRDLDGNWELLADPNGGTTYNSQGTATDNTYVASNYIGLFSDYTSTRHDLFEYDDIKVTRIIPPLDLQNVSVEDNQLFDVTFNQDIDETSIQNTDFIINNGVGNPDNTSVSGQGVTLSYNSPLDGGNYTLTISDEIQSQSGNSLAESKAYNFAVFDSFERGDIIINEFMFDPPPGDFNFDDEYIEIRNTTNKIFNLQNWLLGNDSSFEEITDDTLTLEANEYIVIAADSATLKQVFGEPYYVEPNTFPGLVNSGDAIRLQTNEGTLVDSLTYTSDWGGTDVALERRSASTASIYQENWGNSPNPNGGTPGVANEVSKDNTPPKLTGLNILSTQTLQVVFNERLNQAGSYNITTNNISSVDQTAADTVELSLGSPLQDAQDYLLSIEGAKDIFSNTISSTDTSFTFYNPSPVDSGNVAINEFMYAPPANSSEYIEIYNHSNKSLDLQGWVLSDNRKTFEGTIINDPFIVPPDSFVVIAPDNTIESEYPDISLITMGNFPALNNGGDQIIIRDQSGTLLDSLAYTSDWGGDEIALERRTVNVSGSYQSNWGDAPNEFGTPGSVNAIEPDQTSPNLASFNIMSSNSIEVGFNEPITSSTLEDPNNYQLSSSIEIDQASASGENSVRLSLSSALENAVDYQLTIDGIQDLYDNTLTNRDTTFTYYEISSADSGDVFISEFMSVPPSGSTEYIELRNTTSKSFDLQGWTLNDNTGNRQTITDHQWVLPPDSAIAIAPDQTLNTDFPNIALITMGSSFPSLNNSGDNIVIRTADGTHLDSLQYKADWGTDEVALERRSYNLSAIYQSNWDDAPSGFGTPGTQNEITSDETPPILENLIIINNREIVLTYSEHLNKSTTEDASNYSFTSNISIDNAHFSAPDSVTITLGNNLRNATSYELSIENITDLFGNSIAATDTSFTFFDPSPVDSADIAINEFMYIPTDESSEYIELYNHSNKSLDLQGWTLSDNRKSFEVTITNNQFIVPPDSFVVIAPDNTIQEEYSNIALVAMSDFPALNNGGDQILIRDQSGVLLDSLAYTSEWGGNEVALERRTVDVSGTYSNNWDDAPNNFGTPGTLNEVPQDETAPTFENVVAIDNNKVELIFSEKIAPSSATNKQHYRLSPSIGIQLISMQEHTVTLFLKQQLTDGEVYEMTASNIADIFGNVSSPTTLQFEYLQIDEAQSGQIVINEILYKPGSDGKADFIELHNTSDKNFDLTNWKIGDYSTETTIEEPLKLEAGEYLVLTGNPNFATEISNAAIVSGFPSLNNNTPDDVYIRNTIGSTIDSLRYYQQWGGNTDGSSLERKDPQAASNDPSNWQTNNSNGGISAGTQNISFQEDTNGPEIIFSKSLPGQTFEVQFNEFIQLTDEVAFYNGDQQLSVVTFDSTNANHILLETSTSKTANANEPTIRAENLQDVKGNVTSNSDIAIAQPLQNGDLVINEIMFNPLADADDNQPDQTEYIELRNTQDYAISLEGLFLHDEPDENGDIREIQPVSTTGKWVPPQGQVLVHADEATSFTESLTASFFGLEPTDLQSIMRADRASLSLASSDDAIYIADSTGATIDSVFFDESWHNPNIIDTRGIALERISPNGPSDNESNWGSSVTEKGGTPNNENSIYQENADVTEETGISFEPNPFSPDDDGYEDNLFINYKLDQQDYLMKVRIYDRYGRHVRTLADGKQAGFEGQLIWDGRKNDNSRNRIGIYIVIFEAYDSASGNDKTFKKTVVLARRLN